MKKIFYGWYIVIGGFFIMSTCYAVFVGCLNLFLVPITTELGLTRAQFNTNTSIAALVAIISSIFLGKIVGRNGARRFGIFSVIITVIDMICWANVTQLWQMYILAAITGFCVISGTRLLISIMISNWFDEHRGLAVSIALSGSGFGGVVWSQIASYMIAVHGWRSAFLLFAIVTFVLGMPFALAVFRNTPADLGLLPYGKKEESTSSHDSDYSPDNTKNATSLDGTGLPSKKVVRTLSFWMLMIGFLCMGFINGGVIINVTANFTDAGHTAQFAANILTLQMLVVIFGKLIMGTVFDKFGAIAGTALGSITTILATISLMFASTTTAPVLFALTFGFGTCLGTIAPSLLVIQIYGKKDMGSLVGYITAIQMLGSAIGSILSGKIYDLTGTYRAAWTSLTIMGVIMFLTILYAILAFHKEHLTN